MKGERSQKVGAAQSAGSGRERPAGGARGPGVRLTRSRPDLHDLQRLERSEFEDVMNLETSLKEG